MKIKFCLLALSISIGLAIQSQSYAVENLTPNKILIIDSFTDFGHVALKKYSDQKSSDLIKELLTPKIAKSTNVSLMEALQQQSEIQMLVSSISAVQKNKNQIELMQAFSDSGKCLGVYDVGQLKYEAEMSKASKTSLNSLNYSNLRQLMNDLMKMQSMSETQAYIEKGLELAHGTHTGGLAVDGLDENKTKLVALSALQMETYLKSIKTNKQSNSSTNGFDSVSAIITKIIQDYQIRVVSLSMASDNTLIQSKLQDEDDERLSTEDAKKVHDFNKKTLEDFEAHTADFKKIFALNPNTIFVIAAGNENTDISSMRYALNKLKLPNVLVVGSIDRTTKIDVDHPDKVYNLSRFSNYSTDDLGLNIVAPGTCILGPLTDFGLGKNNKYIYMNGTSMATPIVTNKVARILESHPEYTPEKAISEMISEYTVPVSYQLNSFVVKTIPTLVFNEQYVRSEDQKIKSKK